MEVWKFSLEVSIFKKIQYSIHSLLGFFFYTAEVKTLKLVLTSKQSADESTVTGFLPYFRFNLGIKHCMFLCNVFIMFLIKFKKRNSKVSCKFEAHLFCLELFKVGFSLNITATAGTVLCCAKGGKIATGVRPDGTKAKDSAKNISG